MYRALNEHSNPDHENTSYADRYFERKYSSDFMKEMNRSAGIFLRPWIE